MGDNTLTEILGMGLSILAVSYLFYKNYYNRLKRKKSLSDFQQKFIKKHEKFTEKRDLILSKYLLNPALIFVDECGKGYDKLEKIIISSKQYKRIEPLKRRIDPYAEKIANSIDYFIKL